MLNLKFPLVTKDYEPLPVTIVSDQGRVEGYPLLGYVGEKDILYSWNLEGKNSFSYSSHIENLPVECSVWIVLFSSGEMIASRSFSAIEGLVQNSSPEDIASVIQAKVPVPLGVRDDKPADEIVKEFSTITTASNGNTVGVNADGSVSTLTDKALFGGDGQPIIGGDYP